MKHFSINELTRTSTGLPNTPSAEQLANLEHLVNRVLDPAREWLGQPITINSGFRSPAVNAKVGGATSSSHLKGEAADLDTMDNAALFHWLRAHTDYDQIIWEYGNDKAPDWVHVATRRNGGNRRQALRAVKVNGKTTYVNVI